MEIYIQSLWVIKLNIVKMSIYSKLILDSTQSKLQSFKKIKMDKVAFKIKCRHKQPRIAKPIKKRTRLEASLFNRKDSTLFQLLYSLCFTVIINIMCALSGQVLCLNHLS